MKRSQLKKLVTSIINHCAKKIILPAVKRNITGGLFGNSPLGAPLEASTVKSKRKRGYPTPGTALVATGKLAKGLKASGADVYSDGLPAKAQEALLYGTRKMRARNYLSPDQPAKGGKSLQDTCAAYYDKMYTNKVFKAIDRQAKAINRIK